MLGFKKIIFACHLTAILLFSTVSVQGMERKNNSPLSCISDSYKILLSIKMPILKSPSLLQCAAFYLSFATCAFGLVIITKQAILDKKENVPAHVAEFVHTTLQEHGVTQDKIDAIKIKRGDSWWAFHKHMGVPSDDIRDQLQDKRLELPGWKRKINISKMSVLHEWGHLINKDKMRDCGASIIIMPIAYGLGEKLHKMVSKRLSPLPANLIHISAAPLIYFELLLAFAKYREHKADMVAVQLCHNPDMLQHMGDYFLEHHKKRFPHKTSNSLIEKWYAHNVIFRELYYWWKVPMDDHPSDLTRGENFLKAAEALRNQQLEKVNE